jgi:gamma-glutamylcyclotransferase (GGCT)/AIG2-like uncharacterized protein YtfP
LTTEKSDTEYLFVYGWLKSEYHHRLPFEMPGKLIGGAWVKGTLYQVADYPGIKLGTQGKVWGELYEVKVNYDWSAMDEYECALPSFTDNPEYRRVITQSYFNATSMSCWVYEYLHPLSPEKRIHSGRFDG